MMWGDVKNKIDSWSVIPVVGLSMAHGMVPYNGKLHWRGTSCYSNCCFTDGTFHLACKDWVTTNVTVTRSNVEKSNVPKTTGSG
jgi:hypothetical protein